MSRNRYIPKISDDGENNGLNVSTGNNEYNLFNSARAVVTSAIALSRASGFNGELESKINYDQKMNNLMAELNAPTNGLTL